MSYSLRIKRSAAKALTRLDEPDRLRIIKAIDTLKHAPLRGEHMKGELTGLRRVRVGNYRVVYEIAARELLVLVVRIGHRREIYRRRK